MIDCVFLMLVYFMTTSSLERSETEQALPLGQGAVAADPLPAVDKQRLQIGPGWVDWNGARFSLSPSAPEWPRLAGRLGHFREACERAGARPSLELLPEADTTQQDLVMVLDAARRAGIESLQLP